MRSFCYGCGEEVQTEVEVAAPLCPSCKGQADEYAAEPAWMIRRHAQRPQGPLKRDVVEEWIQKGLVGATDEIARVDGAWAPMNTHQDFRAWYTAGHELSEKREQSLKSRRREHTTRDLSRRLRTVGLLVAIVGIGCLTWMAIETRSTVIPEPWIESAKVWWKTHTSSFLDTVEEATTNPEEALQRRVLVDLPGDDLIARLDEALPSNNEPARLHLLKGRDALMKEITDAPDAAVRELELAAVAAPRDVASLAALAEIYGLAGKYEASKADDALVLLSRADLLGSNMPAVLRARTVLAMGSGSYKNAESIAEDCLVMDPENLHCRYYKGIALLAQEKWAQAEAVLNEAHQAAPHVPRFKLALCQAAVQSGSYATARTMIDTFIGEYPQVAEGYALSARLAWLTADYRRALEESKRAVRLEDSDKESRLLAAELELAAGGARAAAELLSPVLDKQELRTHQLAARSYLVGSYAVGALGDTERALELATVAHEVRPNWSPATFATGSALAAAGDLKGAEQILMDAITDDLRPVEAGAFYVKLGRIYQEQRRAKAAMSAYERAIERHPDNEQARLGLVDVYLRLGNLSRAIDTLRSISPTAFEQDDTHPPNSLVPLAEQDIAPLAADLREAISNDIRLSKSLHSMEGIIAYHSGQYGSALGHLERALVESDTDDIARSYIARIKIRQGANLEAEGILSRLLATPGNEGIYSAMRAVARSRGGRERESLQEFQRLVKLVSGSPQAHRLYAEALFRAGQPELALEEAQNAYALDDLDHHARRLVLTQGSAGG